MALRLVFHLTVSILKGKTLVKEPTLMLMGLDGSDVCFSFTSQLHLSCSEFCR
jgi:hypothetical protein